MGNLCGHQVVTWGLHPHAEFAGAFCRDAAEAAVEVGKGLEADVVGYLGDACGRAHEKAFGLFHPGAVHKVGEGQPRGALEELAEVEGTDIDGTSDRFQGHRFCEVVMDEGLGVADGLRLMGGVGEEEAVGAFPQLDGKGLQDGQCCVVAFLAHDRHLIKVHPSSSDLCGGVVFFQELAGHGGKGGCAGRGEADTTGPHGGDGGLTDLHWHEGLHDASDAGVGQHAIGFASFFDWLKAERQFGQRVKGTLVVLKQITVSEVLDESLAAGE